MPSTERSSSRYLKRLSHLRSDASSWRAHWRDLAAYLSPRRARFEASDWTRAGSKMNRNIVNNTGTRAKRILASGMMAGITSPARPWFRLRVKDVAMNQIKRVKLWLEDVEHIILETFAKTNVYNGLALVYDDLAVYGTSSILVEEHPKDIMRVHVPPLGSYHLAVDHAYKVNAFYRTTTLSVEQLVHRFGIENVSTQTRDAYTERQDYDSRREMLQVIEPNDEQMHGNLDFTGMPFRSVWIETGVTLGDGSTTASGPAGSQKIVGESGFNEWPVPSPRWSVVGEDPYGHSPGMEALGDIRALQHMERRRAQALDKIVTPPMVAPALLRKKRVSLLAGDVTYADIPASKQQFQPAYLVDPKVVLLERELARHENRINATFFADLFLMLATSGLRQPITAREVEERHEEKMLQLGPVLERLQDELLDPLIDRAFGILWRRGEIPEPPEELEGVNARPEYISILAQAQKMLAIVGVERLAGYASNMATVEPSIMDKFNSDKSMDEVGDLLGVNPELVRSDDEAEEIREERAQREQLTAESATAAKDAATAGATAVEAIDSSDTAKQMLSTFGIGAQGG